MCIPRSYRQWKNNAFLLFIGFLVLFLDQSTKWLVSTYLPMVDSSLYWYPYGGIGVFHNWGGIEFSINHMTNTGAAWGMLGAYPLLLIWTRIGLIIALTIYLFYINQRPVWRIPLLFVIAGACGNVIDYFIYGHVVDMFHFVFWGYDFPVFNIADSAISTGILFLFLLSSFENPD